jgi:hypothetical protein
VFNFIQKELAPKAADIDKQDNLEDLRVSDKTEAMHA